MKEAASGCEVPRNAKRWDSESWWQPSEVAFHFREPRFRACTSFDRLSDGLLATDDVEILSGWSDSQRPPWASCLWIRRFTSRNLGNKVPPSREPSMTVARQSLDTGFARDGRVANPNNMIRRTQRDSIERENRMEHKPLSRMTTLIALIALVAALMTATAARPAEAITFYHGACSVSAGNGYYSYYWAATTSSDADCTRVGVAWHTGSMSYDYSYPFSIDKSSATHPAGSQSWHYLKNSVSSTTKYLSYTW